MLAESKQFVLQVIRLKILELGVGMKLWALAIAMLCGTQGAFADQQLLECYSNLTNIFEIAIYKADDGSFYHTEVVEYAVNPKKYPMTQTQMDNLAFDLSPDPHLGTKRTFGWEDGAWTYKYADGSHFATLRCIGSMRGPR